ncbi:hypothetical protein IF650_06260 [Cellulosimicrobium terreum]|nr:hypothetical protein [Cellulosimicrobium terreum]
MVSAIAQLQHDAGNRAVHTRLEPLNLSAGAVAVQRAQFHVESFEATPSSRPLSASKQSNGRSLTVGLESGAGIELAAKVIGTEEAGDDLAAWKVGFIQNVTGTKRLALYLPVGKPSMPLLCDTLVSSQPMRDGEVAPWYKDPATGSARPAAPGVPSGEGVEGASATATVSVFAPRASDAPRFDRKLGFTLKDTEYDLSRTDGLDTFTTWVAAQHKTDAPVPLSRALWQVRYGASVSDTQERTVTVDPVAGLSVTSPPGPVPTSATWQLGGASANSFGNRWKLVKVPRK